MTDRSPVNIGLWIIFFVILAAVLVLLFEDNTHLLGLGLDLDPYTPIIYLVLLIGLVKVSQLIIEPLYNLTIGRRLGPPGQLLWNLLYYLVWVVVFFVAIQVIAGGFGNLGITLGIVSAAIIYILQTPILNIAGWFYLVFTRPFKIGDRIEIDGMRGDVLDITLMRTRLRQVGSWVPGEHPTGQTVDIPNATYFSSQMLNASAMASGVFDEVLLSVTFESDLTKAQTLLKQVADEVIGEKMAQTIKDLRMDEYWTERQVREPTVNTRLRDSWIELGVLYFVTLRDRERVRSAISTRIHALILVEPKVEIAYPHLQILRNDKGAQGGLTRDTSG